MKISISKSDKTIEEVLSLLEAGDAKLLKKVLASLTLTPKFIYSKGGLGVYESKFVKPKSLADIVSRLKSLDSLGFKISGEGFLLKTKALSVGTDNLSPIISIRIRNKIFNETSGDWLNR